MAKPWLRPKTGTYYLWVKVPAEYAANVGRTHEKVSLRTKDPVVARQRFVVELAKARIRWKSMERLHVLSLFEANAIGYEFYQMKREVFRVGNKWSPFFELWSGIILGKFVNARPPQDVEAYAAFSEIYAKEIQAFLDKRGMRLDAANRRILDFAIAHALIQAMGENYKNLSRDFSADPAIGRFPASDSPESLPPASIIDSFEDYSKSGRLAPSTVKRWRGVVRALVEFVGHDSVGLLTKKDVRKWIENLLTQEKNPVTVRDVYLASVKSMLNWLVEKEKAASNPAQGIRIDVPERRLERESEFTDDEARIILEAALRPHPEVGETLAGALRWVPWICAYTGARVNEITQLRTKDVKQVQGVWVFHITPDAGTTKNKKRRNVPVHDHLIEQGLLDFVAARKTAEIFYDAVAGKEASETSPPYQKTAQRVANWVRGLGITDTDVMPNHGWRHLFKTLGHDADISPRALDVIQGHAPRTDGEKYGSYRMKTLHREISKMPRFEVDYPSSASE